MEKMFLIVVDAYSKWGEVIVMNQTTAAKTITALRQHFANHGVPEQIVSDNGPQFVSSDFAEFFKKKMVFSTPDRLHTTRQQMEKPRGLYVHSKKP